MYYLVLFLILCIGISLTFGSTECPTGFNHSIVKPHLCFMFTTEKKTFADAESYCSQSAQGNNGHLISIHSAFDNAEFQSLASRKQWDCIWWIGLTNATGLFTWTDGSSYNFNNWDPFEDSGNCSMMNVQYANEWVVKDCSNLFCTACQAEAHLPPSTTPKDMGVAKDCLELFQQGHSNDGVYVIQPSGSTPFKVQCDIKNGGYTVIQNRFDGSLNFTALDLDDYVAGFGNVAEEFWLGLDKMAFLTQQKVEFRMDVWGSRCPCNKAVATLNDVYGTESYSFQMADVSRNFRASVDSFIGGNITGWKAMLNADGQEYGLYDNPYLGGWWGWDCMMIFNGAYEPYDDFHSLEGFEINTRSFPVPAGCKNLCTPIDPPQYVFYPVRSQLKLRRFN